MKLQLVVVCVFIAALLPHLAITVCLAVLLVHVIERIIQRGGRV